MVNTAEILTFTKSLINYRTTEPKWRNWQTRYVQGVVSITLVWVRLPPSAPGKQLEQFCSGCFAFRQSFTGLLGGRGECLAQTAVPQITQTTQRNTHFTGPHLSHCGRCSCSRQLFCKGKQDDTCQATMFSISQDNLEKWPSSSLRKSAQTV